ncbi:unnamed protein product (macronuclear) [Paramecium tetraurelia]|uniref:Uncharacterized protein n=1 Tax=Paramecium tetraurelia TaxID=5888 RepID=A0CPZ4_PARTE|nr:uncharacterized protein GSPATT00038818001 [Paramecium tetraurelia]CAK72861.1 unnamed protein product [Paramecium tetraurelia]|eukprot:XP_001440258.1 hypothetical protein (macronuclear) [Paramecium tetraurelia strain d4-2]
MDCKIDNNENLSEVLAKVKDFDTEIYPILIEMFRREKITDTFKHLNNQKLAQLGIKNTDYLIKILQIIIELDFNKKNQSNEDQAQIRKELIKKIGEERQIIEFLKFLVRLTAVDEKFIQCGSNILNLLVEMKVDLRDENFENIRIRDTSLVGGNFVRCNFNGSEFDNINISGINLNQAQLLNCIWKNIKIHELNKLDGHSQGVNLVCFSPDGKSLASCSDDNSIILWDIKTGKMKQIVKGKGVVKSLCLSPNNTTLAFSRKQCVYLWNLKTRKQKAKLDGHLDEIRSVCFSQDGTTLASSSYDKSIRLWDVKIKQQKAKLDGHSNRVYSVNFSPDGTTLASGSLDKSILLWDVKTGQQKAKLDGHQDYVLSVNFSPDGTTLASGNYDKSILLWDVKTGQQKAKLDGHSYSVQQVCFSPDGSTLASGSADKSIRLWDVKSKQQILSSNFNYRNILAQFQPQILSNKIHPESAAFYITILRISQNPNLEAQGTLILKGQFINYQGVDLKSFFKSKGSLIFQDQFEQKYN